MLLGRIAATPLDKRISGDVVKRASPKKARWRTRDESSFLGRRRGPKTSKTFRDQGARYWAEHELEENRGGRESRKSFQLTAGHASTSESLIPSRLNLVHFSDGYLLPVLNARPHHKEQIQK